MTKTETKKVYFNQDTPIESDDKDNFGFAKIAEKLAKAVTHDDAQAGIVVGIEGAWGSGKSSLLQLLYKKLTEQENNPSIIKFDPWIIGTRDQLVRTLINSIIAEIKKMEGDNKDTVKMLSLYLEKIGKVVSKVSSIISLITGNPVWEKFNPVWEKILEFFQKKNYKNLSLTELKQKIENKLKEINHKFIVMIDDIDRLEPQDAAEVVRLIKAVGDFPNITYILCYDKEILAHSLQVALSVENGKSFLQKIVQVSFPIPHPEGFALQKFFQTKCFHLYKPKHSQKLQDTYSFELGNRYEYVCNLARTELKTPREVVRVLNAIKLYYPQIHDKVDFLDLCWLKIIKITNENLYKWIEKYLVKFASIKNEYNIMSDNEKDNLLSELKEILNIEQTEEVTKNFTNHLSHLEEFLPGINSNSCQQKNIIFDYRAKEKEGCRLGNLKYYRFYFSFSNPSGVLEEDKFHEIIDMIKSDKNIVTELQKLIKDEESNRIMPYESFLDKIKLYIEKQDLNYRSWERLIEGIGNTIDNAARESKNHKVIPFDFVGTNPVLHDGHVILKIALNKMSEKERGDFLKKMFSKYDSLWWLMERIIRGELLSHGKVKQETTNKDAQILTTAELEEAINTILKRLEGDNRKDIINIPNLAIFLWGWRDTGTKGKNDAIKWAKETIRTDEGLLKLLNALKNAIYSNKGISYRLSKENLDPFVDLEQALERLNKICLNPDSENNKQEAQQLIDYINKNE